MERRLLRYEVRASKRGDKKIVEGVAARYDTLSHRMPTGAGGYFRERIAKGAFKRILATAPDCVALMNHDVNKPLGRTGPGTLKLREVPTGLGFTCELPDTSYGNDLYESVTRGDMNQCSFAFSLGDGDDSWDDEEDPEERGRVAVRTIKNFASLMDISIVTNPAYPGTSVDARSLELIEVRSRFEPTREQVAEAIRKTEHALAEMHRRDADDALARERRKSLLDF
jgi:uncharacterized protein